MIFLLHLLKKIGKIFLILAMVLGLAWLAFNWPVEDKNQEMKFGVAFSNVFARDIGLNWKETYLAILDDLKVKKIRVAAYWTEIEKRPGEYDFSDLDFQIEEAKKRNVEVILAFGIKVPRWPECFIPNFYGGNPVEEENKKRTNEEKQKIKIDREIALLKYEKALIERYKGYENIKIWQVENEPFLPFGHCVEGAIDSNLVDVEVRRTKELDGSRPVMVTDSGELSLWIQAASRSDIFGTTLYRIIHKPPFGYVKYPLGPRFFRIKAWFVRMLTNKDVIIISELQAEPWGPDWLPNMSVEEQYKSMNPQIFRDIVDYAEQTGFSDSYLWGAEWWYWLKTQKGNTEMWEEARKVLRL